MGLTCVVGCCGARVCRWFATIGERPGASLETVWELRSRRCRGAHPLLPLTADVAHGSPAHQAATLLAARASGGSRLGRGSGSHGSGEAEGGPCTAPGCAQGAGTSWKGRSRGGQVAGEPAAGGYRQGRGGGTPGKGGSTPKLQREGVLRWTRGGGGEPLAGLGAGAGTRVAY